METPSVVVLPFGSGGHHEWLYAECCPACHQSRRAKATMALRAMGMTPGTMMVDSVSPFSPAAERTVMSAQGVLGRLLGASLGQPGSSYLKRHGRMLWREIGPWSRNCWRSGRPQYASHGDVPDSCSH